jgi:hypothetical protein
MKLYTSRTNYTRGLNDIQFLRKFQMGIINNMFNTTKYGLLIYRITSFFPFLM